MHESFDQVLKKDPEVIIRSPGRINLIGEHTDYNQGFVMPGAIDLAIQLAIVKTNDQKVLAHALDFNERHQTDLNASSMSEKGWQRYVRAMIEVLRESNYSIEGFEVAFGGDIPLGAGLSSSAALCCGMIFGISELFELNIPKSEIALLAQQTEHRVGLNCGLMDQYAVIFGMQHHFMQLDCANMEYQYFPWQSEQLEFVLLNTKVDHKLTDSAYNERRQECQEVLDAVKRLDPSINTVRKITREHLSDLKGQINPVSLRRVQFVLDENERVLNASGFLSEQKMEELGQLLFECHDGLSAQYEVSCPESDFLVDLCRKDARVLGARQMGGGFGGCILTLLEKAYRQSFINHAFEQYAQQFNLKAELISVAIDDGLKRIR